MDSHEKLKELSDKYGADIFAGSKKSELIRLISNDLQQSKLKDLLIIAINQNMASELFNVRMSNESTVNSTRDSLKKQFCKNNNQEDRVAHYIIDSLAYAIGLIPEMNSLDNINDVNIKIPDNKIVVDSSKNINTNNTGSSSSKTKIIIAAVVVLVLLIGGGYFGYKYYINNGQSELKADNTDSNVNQEIINDEEIIDSDDTDATKEVGDNVLEPENATIEEITDINPVNETTASTKEEGKIKPESMSKPDLKLEEKKSEPVVASLPEKKENTKEEVVAPIPEDKSVATTEPQYKTINYLSGEKYEGYVNNMNLKHGKGTYYWKSGNRYTGDWVNDKATGKGIYYSHEGWRYEGEFLNAQFHGKGIYYFANGKKKEGTWINGQMTK